MADREMTKQTSMREDTGEPKTKAGHLKLTVACISSVVGALFAFLRLADIPWEARFGVVGVSAFVPVVSYFIWHFQNTRPGEPPKKASRVAQFLGLVVLCGASVVLFELTITYHNVRIFRHKGSEPSTGQVEFQPPGSPTDLRITLWIPQSERSSLEAFPASWNTANDADWGIEDQGQFQLSLSIRDFERPQVFGVWYRLSGPDGEPQVNADPLRAYVRVIEQEELSQYSTRFLYYGEVLCFLGTVLLFYLWCFYPKRLARHRRNSLILER